MTACILSGFAKKKKYVGTIYACDGSDLPATQDFGTVQFSGPFEAAQTVPATEVTYTIIGKTQCGDDIRRITTRTYSSRSVAGQVKLTGEWTGNNPAGTGYVQPQNPGIFSTVYGSTLAVAQQNLVNEGIAKLTAQVTTCTYDGHTYDLPISLTTILINNNPVAVAHRYSSNPDYYSIYTYICVYSQSTTTIYYLDVNEVWTYDLV